MGNLTVIKENVDIYKLPKASPARANNIIIGDLHGNTMKLIFMLVKHGIASNISVVDYNKLVEIYQTPNLTAAHLNTYNKILNKMQFDNTASITLIGDELADRGSNDYLTLKVFEKLHDHKVSFEILISNHGVEFIEAYEKQDNFHAPMLSMGHADSLENLQKLVERGIVSRQNILRLANKSYKQALRAITYSLNEDKSEITILSHAGIGLETIQNLAKKFQVIYQDESAQALAVTIDNINKIFQSHVNTNTVHTLYSRDQMMLGYQGHNDLKEYPLVFVMWNRLYDRIFRPSVYQNYKLNFVHGHDPIVPTQDNIYNLDNSLGKKGLLKEMEGEYTFISIPQIPKVIAKVAEVIANEQPAEKEFLTQLNILRTKAEALEKRGFKDAARHANHLHEVLSDKYAILDSKRDYATFKDDCLVAINDARPILSKHRGWKRVIGNIALAVIGLGVIFAAAIVINKAATGNFLFFKTDSAKKIDAIEQTIHSDCLKK